MNYAQIAFSFILPPAALYCILRSIAWVISGFSGRSGQDKSITSGRWGVPRIEPSLHKGAVPTRSDPPTDAQENQLTPKPSGTFGRH
jgi:hypothetical protein